MSVNWQLRKHCLRKAHVKHQSSHRGRLESQAGDSWDSAPSSYDNSWIGQGWILLRTCLTSWVSVKLCSNYPGIMRLQKQGTGCHTLNTPEKWGLHSCKRTEKLSRCLGMCLVVSAAAWVFRETLCEVTAGTWLLCFEWASFVAAENRGEKRKRKRASLPGRIFSAAPAGLLLF